MAQQQVVFEGSELKNLGEKKTHVIPLDDVSELRSVGRGEAALLRKNGQNYLLEGSLKTVLERWAASKDELFINLTENPDVPKALAREAAKAEPSFK